METADIRNRKCPICGSTGSSFLLKNKHDIYVCDHCSHQYISEVINKINVVELYGDEYFNGGKDGYPDYLSYKDILIKHGERYSKVILKYINIGKVLDAGSAAGFILYGFISNGWEGKGVEPNYIMAKYGIDHLHLDVCNTTFEDYTTDEKYDLILMIQVISHFYDLNRSISNANKILKKGGYVLVETWNQGSLLARSAGANWHEYSPPSVRNWFTVKSLRMLMENHGFKEVYIGRPTKYILFNHVKSLLEYKYSKNYYILSAIKLLSRFMKDSTSIRYPAIDLFYGIYKKVNTDIKFNAEK